ncbi:MFS transporter [Sagittula salina]|uniref:MFS transporter n=1 Tax=Sagittula salina TaxID=2820268 RepID=A0A940MPE1_9RHOB|nr:MFS transporter [Sagittula salina]MBP0481707.1 MFS transporter [Sagittula salina]
MSETREAAYGRLTGATDAPEVEAKNGLRHMVSLSMTKVADGLIDPKLVLSWLAGSLGVPAAVVSAFVPIREAGALLPQILLAGRVEAMRRRKWAWVAGAVGQGLAAAAIAIAALLLEGIAAGVAIACALAVLAVSRSLASVSYKDILGKTVAKTRRGAVTGMAGSAASFAVLGFALLLIFGIGQGPDQKTGPVVLAIALAALLWLAAAAVFSTVEEKPSRPEDEGPVWDLTPLRDDPQFRRFILARGALTVTALAPPYFVMLVGGQAALSGLGALLLASSAASFLSSYVWGRLSDRSSRLVLALSGFVASVFMALAVALERLGLAASVWVVPVVLFGLMVAYHGVRQGRSVYLVDMSPADARASYAALANTLIGGLLLAVGALGGVLATLGPVVALAGFAALSALGGVLALGLDEVEAE